MRSVNPLGSVPSVQDAFARLEQLALRVGDELGRLRRENSALKEELETLRRRLAKLEAEGQQSRRLVERFRRERADIRSRAASILVGIASLERPDDP